MIPIGAKVRWKDSIHKSPWVGVVTGHDGNFCEVDGKSKISAGLLAVVEDAPAAVGDDVGALVAELSERNVELRAEVEALQALVAEQCGIIAGLPGPTTLDDWRDWASTAEDLLRGYLLVLTGSAYPTRRVEPDELQALLDHITNGGP